MIYKDNNHLTTGAGPDARSPTQGAGSCRQAHQELVCQSAQDQSDIPHAEPVQPGCHTEVSDSRVLGACAGH